MKQFFCMLLGCLCVFTTAWSQNECNPSSTYAIPLPSEISFCGQKVDLNRLDIRERLDREILSMNYMHSSTLQIIKRANRYFPIIEPILKQHGLPDDFKYLCCIESSLNPKALSSAGAAGLWQFIPSTGREYGMQVDSQVDERYHVWKSTAAACRYLLDAYELYHDWFLTAASYNAGTKRISTELEQQQCTSYFDLWLNEETSRYVYRILACKLVMESPQSYGFMLKASDLYQPIDYTQVSVGTSVESWTEFALKHQLTYKQLKEANLWMRDRSMQNPRGKVYQVSLPTAKSLRYDERHLYVHQKKWIVND